jgi:type IV pilus assembly protein PilX
MTHPTRHLQQGMSLILALLFIVVLTLLGLAMFRSSGLQEKIAGNTRETQRALEAAQGALQYGEWWLAQGSRGTGGSCAGAVDGTSPDSLRVCATALAVPTTLPWSNRIEFLPAAMTVAAGGGLAANGDINYAGRPGLHISYLGLSPTGEGMLYQVTAYGYGGNENSVAVVRSTYELSSNVKDLGRE